MSNPHEGNDELIVREFVIRLARKHLETNTKEDSTCNLHQIFVYEMEVGLFQSVMQHVGWNKSQAAKILGISRVTLKKKLIDLNLRK